MIYEHTEVIVHKTILTIRLFLVFLVIAVVVEVLTLQNRHHVQPQLRKLFQPKFYLYIYFQYQWPLLTTSSVPQCLSILG